MLASWQNCAIDGTSAFAPARGSRHARNGEKPPPLHMYQAVEKLGPACQPAPGPQPGRRRATHRLGNRSGSLLSETPFRLSKGFFNSLAWLPQAWLPHHRWIGGANPRLNGAAPSPGEGMGASRREFPSLAPAGCPPISASMSCMISFYVTTIDEKMTFGPDSQAVRQTGVTLIADHRPGHSMNGNTAITKARPDVRKTAKGGSPLTGC